MNKAGIMLLITAEIIELTGHHSYSIDPHTKFQELGLTSLQTLKVINRLRRKLSLDINPIAMFEYETIAEFSGYLANCKNY